MKRLSDLLDKIKNNSYIYLELLVAFIISILYFGIKYIIGISMMSSDGIDNVLLGTISTISIIIGLFSVLLTSVSTKKSEIVIYFFSKVSNKDFVSQIKKTILVGSLGLGVSMLLLIRDILLPIEVYLEHSWLFFLSYFVVGAYKFISLLLEMLTDERTIKLGKRDNQQIVGEEEEAMKIKMLNKYNDQ